jgi:serine/threonine protein kinase
MTDYVATRWYRAPEVLLTFKKYSTAMDMWSVGCIFGELLLRKPLLPGTDANHQLELIFTLLGTPSDEDTLAIPNIKSRDRVTKLAKKQGKAFEMIFRDCNPQAVDLIKKLLVFNPDKRFTVEQALSHPYLQALHFKEDEPSAIPVSMFDFEFEKHELSLKGFKDLIYDEILLHHFIEKREEYEKAKREYESAIHLPVRRYSRDLEESDDENDDIS